MLTQALGVPPLVAAVLVRRGFADPESAARYLDPSLDRLYDPELLPDYREAVQTIVSAVRSKELIYVHGDYDVDGVTSASLFAHCLEKLGANVHAHVPHRTKEGYGIHLDAVADAAERGAKLFLTCDCGVSAHDQIRQAREAGMVVVVTDHHEVLGELPEGAAAIVNPHRPDSSYPFPQLCGVGVAFKVCEGVVSEMGFPLDKFRRAYLDIVALGTIADVMPLVDENRVLVRHGLPLLAETRRAGLKALLKVADFKPGRAITARQVAFQIAPRINAVGRIDDAGVALRLLLTKDEAEAEVLATRLNELNTQRRAEQQAAVATAIAQLEQRAKPDRKVIVVANYGWHHGVIGLVAGDLCKRFHRPSFVIGIDGEGARGSARSIPGFHLGDVIKAHGDLIRGGGHAAAAGFSVASASIEALESALEAYAETILTPDMLQPCLELDAVVQPDEAGVLAYRALSAMEPLGHMNPPAGFASLDMKLVNLSPFANPAHARLRLQGSTGPQVDAVAFGIGEQLAELEPGAAIDVVFHPEENTYNGTTRFRWVIDHFRPSEG